MQKLRRLSVYLAALGAASSLAITCLFCATARADHSQIDFFEAPAELLNPAQRSAALEQLKKLGVKALRVELHWYDVAPQSNSATRPRFDAEDPDSYNWGQYDLLMAEAQRLKFKILMTVTSPVPKWATSTHKDLVTRPNASEFEEFMVAVGRHFSSQVPLWAIWNEPNVAGWLSPQFNPNGTPASPLIYRGLFQAGYRGLIASGLSSPKVLFGETAPFGLDRVNPRREGPKRDVAPLAFLRDSLCLSSSYRRQSSCQMLHIYGYSDHPYTYPAVPGPYYRPSNRDDLPIGVLSRLSSALVLAAHAYSIPAHVPIYLTEYGVQSSPNPTGVSLSHQAEYQAISERLAWENPDVAAFAQYLLRDEGKRGRYAGYRTGLEGVGGSPKPLYYAYAVPLTVTATSSGYSLWGLVRPANGSTTVQIQVKASPSDPFRTLQTVRTNTAGYWTLRSRVRGLSWRARWRSPAGVLYIGPPIRAF